MSQYTFAHDETDELVFRKPRSYQMIGIFLALACLGLLLINFYGAHQAAITPDPYPVRAEFNRIAPRFLDVVFTIMGFGSLYLGCPYVLRFDPRRGTYEIQEGWFPFRGTTRGTMADIASIYVAYINTQGSISYHVFVRWKRGGWHVDGRSMLTWGENLASAEDKAREYAQMLGVPRGPTKLSWRQAKSG